MSLLKTLMSDLGTITNSMTAISTESTAFGKNTPYTLYPCMNYNVITSNIGRIPSYSSSSETFNVQFSVFDDNANGTDLLDIDEELEDTLTTAVGLSSNSFQEVLKQGMIGPRYLQDQKYWQLIRTYNITLAKER